ncbi:MAG: hypothetical protein IPM24_03890 [Bryobacterales bacterium]|nr:hypothetical protein [Bryobacterales bacterium]
MGNKKRPNARFDPPESKQPRTGGNPQSYWSANPSWRIRKLVWKDRFGWHKVQPEQLESIRSKLGDFEERTWGEILNARNNPNHPIPFHKLCDDARRRFRDENAPEAVVSLRLSGRERIWGVMENGVLSLLWWDPEHEVCPTLKKHT